MARSAPVEDGWQLAYSNGLEGARDVDGHWLRARPSITHLPRSPFQVEERPVDELVHWTARVRALLRMFGRRTDAGAAGGTTGTPVEPDATDAGISLSTTPPSLPFLGNEVSTATSLEDAAPADERETHGPVFHPVGTGGGRPQANSNHHYTDMGAELSSQLVPPLETIRVARDEPTYESSYVYYSQTARGWTYDDWYTRMPASIPLHALESTPPNVSYEDQHAAAEGVDAGQDESAGTQVFVVTVAERDTRSSGVAIRRAPSREPSAHEATDAPHKTAY